MSRLVNRRSTQRPLPEGSQETRAADFMTIGWMLAALTTLLCTAAAVLLLPLLRIWPDQSGLHVLSGFLLFAGTVVGLATIILLMVVLRARTEAPPRPLVVGSVGISLLAPILLLLRLLGWL